METYSETHFWDNFNLLWDFEFDYIFGLKEQLSYLEMSFLLLSIVLICIAVRLKSYIDKKSEHLLQICKKEKPNAEFAQVYKSLQQDLTACIEEKIQSVQKNIEIKLGEMQKQIECVTKNKDEDLAIVHAKYSAENQAVEEKFTTEVAKITADYMDSIYTMKRSVQSLNLVLDSPNVEQEVVCNTKTELECPVCMEEMKPPRRIWQCSDGHPVCENCKKKPEVTCCPTCRKFIIGRSTIAEKVARALYCDEIKDGEK